MKTNTASSAIARVLLVVVLLVLACPVFAVTPGAAKWELALGPGPDYGLSHPARARNGTIYVGCDDGHLYAINPDGTLKWNFDAGCPITTRPAVYYSPDGENAQYNGRIYIGLANGRILSIGPSGNLKWLHDTGIRITASPALAADGTVYFGAVSLGLVAIKPNGQRKWSFSTIGWGTLQDPAVAPDGTIYFGTYDGESRFYAVNPNRTLKWVRELPDPVTSPAAIGLDGTIYFGADHALYALYPNGDTKWRKAHDPYMITSSPAIGHEGTIYYCADTLIARSPDGSWLWDFWYEGTRPTTYDTSPAVDSNGLIYFGAQEGYLYTVAPGGTFVWRYRIESGGDVASAPIVGGDGILYFTVRNVARALYTGSTGGFNSAWPMCGHDPQRTARLDRYWSMMSEIKNILVAVRQSALNRGIKNSLVVKLESTMQSLKAGRIRPTVHKLGAFIHQVEALEGKKIPEEIADILIRDALHILTWADGDD